MERMDWKKGLLLFFIAINILFANGPVSPAWSAAVQAPITGEIERIFITNVNDIWSGGEMVVGGQSVVVPRNLLIDLPANRLTLAQLYRKAPASCLAANETGLAKADGCNLRGTGAIATILANRTAGGDVIAGELKIAKGMESVTGLVTYINYTDGYFRLNGKAINSTQTDDNTGVMVRVNDPDGRHTVQQGAGCGGGPNCSPDIRFGIDSSNYTFAFATGYPPCIPSTVTGVGGRATGSGANGVGDPFCPDTNRPQMPALLPLPALPAAMSSPDSTLFAPLKPGDNLTATGNFENINLAQFLSAHTVRVFVDLTTKDDPTQPDYMIFDETEWDAPPYFASRVRARFIGATSLHNSELDIYAVRYDKDNTPHEVPIASTANNIKQGVIIKAGGPIGVFATNLQVNLLKSVADLSPCAALNLAGFTKAQSGCSTFAPTTAQDFNVVVPVAREVIGKTRHKAKLKPGVVTRDIRGNIAQNGQYLTPVSVGFEGFADINLGLLHVPYSFSAITWNLDRRLSPGGCAGQCESTPQPLDPFPFEGFDPRTVSILAPLPGPDRMLSYYPFGSGDLLTWPPGDPAAMGVPVTPQLTLVCGAAAPVVPAANVNSISGTINTAAGASISDVLVTLSGPSSGTAVTDANGNYSFIGLAAGAYTVAAARPGFTFAPASLSVAVNGSDRTGIGFTGAPPLSFSISGTVRTTDGGPLAGVSLLLDGASTASTVTAGDGTYTISGLFNGSYTLTAESPVAALAPSSLPVLINGGDMKGLNFTGTMLTTFTISGSVTTAAGSGISATTMILSGAATGTTTADSDGVYSFSGLLNGAYIITPAKVGTTFTPANVIIRINGANETQNFIATAPKTFSISGKVTGARGPAAGVEITLDGLSSSTFTTGSNGAFSFTGLVPGTYTITPTGGGFKPLSKTVTIRSKNVNGVSFKKL